MYHEKQPFSKKSPEIHRKFTILFEKFSRNSPEIHQKFTILFKKFTRNSPPENTPIHHGPNG